MSPPNRSNMAAKRVFTESEVEDLVAKVLGRKKAEKPSADVEKALRKQDAEYYEESWHVRNVSASGQ